MCVCVVAVAPLIPAPIRKPSLDWIEEDTSLHYRTTNATQAYHFNITVDKVIGGAAVFDYWHTDNGTDLLYLKRNQSKDNRTDLVWDGFETSLFVNETNVVDGSAKIGRTDYELVESTLENHVFANSSTPWTFYYDTDKGYINKAVFDNGNLSFTTELVEEYKRAPPNQTIPTSHEEPNCQGLDHVEESTKWSEIHPVGLEHRGTVYVHVKLCWNEPNPDTQACNTRHYVEVGTTNPAWYVFDYEYDIWLNEVDHGSGWEGAEDEEHDTLGTNPLQASNHESDDLIDVWVDAGDRSRSRGKIVNNLENDDFAMNKEQFTCQDQ